MKSLEKRSRITPEILRQLPSPCWLLEEQLLEQNLMILKDIKDRAGVKILLALKGYALWHSFPLVREYLDGCCASGLYEAKLSHEAFGRETHTYSPAFKAEEIDAIARISHHLVFNSPAQLQRFGPQARTANPTLSLGLRVNPQYSEAPVELYNPCGLHSRLGTLAEAVDEATVEAIEGFHFHALCEQDASALEGVLQAFEEKFGRWLPRLKWVNFGGGHHITRKDYDRERLILILNNFKSRHPHLEVYLEPGEAVGWETGPLVATVLDIVNNGMEIAILDTSAEAHMPDTIIMPYKAQVRGAAEPGEKPYTYRLAGNTCLAGDVMRDYSFDRPLKIGDKILFEDQMHYTMVKATTFNGIPLPALATLHRDGSLTIDRQFGYEDFKSRLG
ncbi:carboxynorspermidine decarboxylase [Nitratifractor sp.]|uniref:carboxynorspermidine decarboxylase n=1 Tax=Nitratifractor sp. TaxID=2268144 RepID=UPI0025DF2D74|nr:carboxynorspermidine decarboxylase [Nitratifractor sp.]